MAKVLRDRFKQIRELLDEAHAVAMVEVEVRARKLMKDHPSITCFVMSMSMGTATFYKKTTRVGEIYNDPIDDSDLKYLKPFYDFIYEYDPELRLTGTPLRLDSWDGPALKDW